MKELDKEKMGLFIAQLRREKEATQKELGRNTGCYHNRTFARRTIYKTSIRGGASGRTCGWRDPFDPRGAAEGRKEAASFMERDMDFVCHCRSGAGWIFVGVCDSCGGIGDLCVVGRGVNFGVQRIFLLFCQGTSA